MANKIEKKKEVKLNVNYVLFIKELVASKIEISQKNRQSIESLYSEVVNLKFNNLPRVASRVARKENKAKLVALLKESKIEEKVFNNASKLVLEVSKTRKNNYL